MSLEKVAIKNERPGVMIVPGLRPPDDDRDAPEPTEGAAEVETTATR